MRILCLLVFSTMLSTNMAMKMVSEALNFDSHTLKLSYFRAFLVCWKKFCTTEKINLIDYIIV